jgi:transposase-like protein
MVSVALGAVEIQLTRQTQRQTYVEMLQEEIGRVVREVAQRCLEGALEAEVTAVLGREWYARRAQMPHRVTQAQCKRCGTRAAWRFQRNGHYSRCVETLWGRVTVRMPQLKCDCGGSVQVAFQTLRPRQRIWDDVAGEIRERYGWGESLRAIKAGLDRQLGSSLGLRTLTGRIHAVAELAQRIFQTQQADCPPVVRLDGLWIPQMVRTGKQRMDQLGRLRPVKRGERRPLLLAQGVWPAEGRQAVVGWVLSESEATAGWTSLLELLWDRGIRPQRGLALLTADGGAGLTPARQLIYWNVPFQRCVFHKLRNVWRAIVLPEGLTGKPARAYKRRVIREAAQIWQPQRVATARQRQTAWCLAWEADQAQAVATLRRDFDATLTFYQVQAQAQQRGEAWPATALRTTSQLERLFRGVRRRVRQAVVLHSPVGVRALAHQSINRWAAGQSADPRARADWPLELERALAATDRIS